MNLKAIAAIAECDEAKANTDLIVAAFNSATACADMGYDGIKAVEALPKLLEALRECVLALSDHVELMARRENTSPEIVCPCKSTTLAKARSILAQAGQKQLSPQ